MDQAETNRLPFWIGQIASVLIGTIGVGVLVSRAFGLDLVRVLEPGWATMAPLTALCFLFAAIALSLLLRGSQQGPRSTLLHAGLWCAAIPTLVGLLRLVAYLIDFDPGWDLLGFAPIGEHSSRQAPTAMSPATALSFLLLGSAMVLSVRQRFVAASQLIALTPLALVWMGLSHYVYGGKTLLFFSAMSAPTSVTVGLLCAGVIFLRPQLGLVRWLRGDQSATDTHSGTATNRLFTIGITLGFAISLGIFFEVSRLELQQDTLVLNTAHWLTQIQSGAVHDKLLAERVAKLERDTEISRQVTANGIGLGLALSVIVFVMLRRENRLRYHAQTGLQQTNTILEQRVRERTAELTRTNELLRVSENLFRSVVTSTNQCVWTVRKDGQATEGIEKESAAWWCTMAGQTEAQRQGADGFGWLSVVHEQDRDAMRNFWMTLQHSTEQILIEFRVINPEEGLRWILTHSVPVRNDKGDVIAWIGTTSDITKRKLAEIALQESEDRFRKAFENGPMGIAITSTQSRLFTHVNKAFCNMLGYTEAEMQSLMVADVTHPDDRAADREIYRQIIEGNIQEKVIEKRYITKRGEIVWGLRALAALKNMDGEIVSMIAMIQDITANKRGEAERIALENQLRQSQKMEAIGTLAGGIAHDFNNILAGINGFAALAQQSLDDKTQLNEYIEHINLAGKRAANLVQQILAFSRVGDQSMAPLQWRHIIAEAVKLLRAAIPSSIEIETTLLSPLPPVLGNATQLHQVIMNLGANAAFAMRERAGKLSIRLDLFTVSPALAQQLPDISAGEFVRLTVTDTGVGMDANTQSRMFDPFFTTKDPGQGTGLGLSVVHGIVRNHRGVIRVNSTMNHGTTFEILLPAEANAMIAEEPSPTRLPRGNGERILVVDDEEVLTELAERMLSQLGYSVDCDVNVLEALARIERNPDAYKLIISDQTMPAMSGLEFAKRVHTLRPSLPVLITSGFSHALSTRNCDSAGVNEVLPKPYTMESLATAVHRQLNRQ